MDSRVVVLVLNEPLSVFKLVTRALKLELALANAPVISVAICDELEILFDVVCRSCEFWFADSVKCFFIHKLY